jgi:hypothetical protein
MTVFQDDNSFVTIIEEEESPTIIAPLHLPHGAVLRDIDVLWRKFSWSNNVYVSIERKNMYSDDKVILGICDSEAILFPTTIHGERVSFGSLPINQRTIDLSQYSYRIVARFSTNSDFEDAAAADIRLYGARIRYEH